jgi:hypothetical protein
METIPACSAYSTICVAKSSTPQRSGGQRFMAAVFNADTSQLKTSFT